jgi:uncharacterized membrane protein YraQ (UPF0718 family)
LAGLIVYTIYSGSFSRTRNIKKIIFLSAIALTIAAIFLSVSRGPALDQKAQMGLRTDISSIAFDIIFEVNEQQPYLERVFKSAVNWSYTNWKGMTFGILFGATVLSLMRSLPIWRLPGRGFSGALQGLIGGAPLGVCVNCATPIAQGLHRAGIRLETMLAVMMASPTLNLIVITMLLSLFSWYFVLIKLGATLFFILVLIPGIVWLWSRYTVIDDAGLSIPGINNPLLLPTSDSDTGADWIHVIGISLSEIFGNLLFILKISLPLMLLAGFLGAMLIESISLDTIANLPSNLTSYILIALVGVFLPVPIAFDVILTSALVSIGLPPGLAMTLFFSLSIFSIFPALIIGKDVSWGLSALLAVMVVVVAILSGLVTERVHEQIVMREQQQIEQGLQQLSGDTAEPQEVIPTGVQTKVSLASTLCSSLPGPVDECLLNLLQAKTFGALDDDLCVDVAESDRNLASNCRQLLVSTRASKQAIHENDISLCADFDCRMAYLNATSHIDGAVGRCDSSVATHLIQLCRQVVLYNRIIHFRNKNACTDDLNPGEMAFCRSEITARIAMEQMDLATCEALSVTQARHSCYMAVITVKIIDMGDQFQCADLPSSSYRTICNNLQTKQTAMSSQSLAECDGLEPRQARSCQTEVIKLMVQASQQGRIAPLSIPDVASADKPLTTSFTLPVKVQADPFLKVGDVSISLIAARSRAPASGRFEVHPGANIGIDQSWSINATDLFEPFIYGKGISSGDINNDGYPDLIVAFERGVYVYMNLGTGKFALANRLIPTDDFNAFLSALVDFNNDGYLDIFVSAYGGKQYFYLSDEGNFTKHPEAIVTSTTSALTMAAGFADLDQDADLDVVLGRWSHGIERHFRTFGANNQILLNQSGILTRLPLFAPDPPGATLSVLLSDLNADSIVDIVTGNDRQVPDIFHFSDAPLSYSYPPAGMIPETSLNTMSYDSADFNNDLQLDLFSSDMTFSDAGHENYCDSVAGSQANKRCKRLIKIQHEVDDFNIEWCNTLTAGEQIECLAASILEIAIRESNSDLCQKIPVGFPAKRQYCLDSTGDIPPNKDIDLKKYPPQLTTNKFLMAWRSRFIDVTEDIGVARSNWSWNARAFDIDNDRFQDILVGTGYGFGSSDSTDLMVDLQVFPNVVFHNQKGSKFVRAEDDFGLGDYINTSSFTLTDFDLDGDMDIIEYGQLVGIRLYENRVSKNNSITFLFDDHKGNRFCIGCKITISSRSGKQIREIKASGGFLSFDEPIALFGLGTDEEVTRVKIQWSTGEVTTLDQPLDANHRYLIARQ